MEDEEKEAKKKEAKERKEKEEKTKEVVRIGGKGWCEDM